MAGPMENGRSQNQDRRINKESEHERAGRVDTGVFDGFAFALRSLLELARLHDRRVEVKIVRHHRRSNDADADVKHFLVRDDVRAGHKTEYHADKVWFGKDQLRSETTGDGCDERNHQRLDVTKPLLLEVKNGQHVECGNTAAPHEGNTE